MNKNKNGTKFLSAVILLFLAAGPALSATLTFLMVGRTLSNAEQEMHRAGARSTVGRRYVAWAAEVVRSGGTRWGVTNSGSQVTAVLAERLPSTVKLGLGAWVAAWSAGLALAVLGTAFRPRLGAWYVSTIYPLIEAVPAVAVVLLGYRVLLKAGLASDESASFATAAVTLTALLLPGTLALWVNAIGRVLSSDFVRAARDRGLAPWQLWRIHVLPHVFLSSGIPVHAAVLLAHCLTGSFLVEQVFSVKGGLAVGFVKAVTTGDAAQASTIAVLFYVVLATAMLLAQGVVLWLNPDPTVFEEAP